MDILRISTAGSVDDGKSTLIGRLLYDNDALTIEQEQLIAKKTKEKGLQDLDFSVITDGLIAEREQGITIDVAHIYFSTQARKFIIADSPGHVEYTRNMVTGASNAEISVILIDARKGLLEQSHRHFFISQLLQLHTVVFCINKMDLVDYSEDVFLDIAAQIKAFTQQFSHSNPDLHILPISSLKGDNVVHVSEHMPWYQGDTLNQLLHSIRPEQEEEGPFRMEVQNVLHVQNETFVDFRGYTGRIASGSISVGDQLAVLPSGKTATLSEIRHFNAELPAAEKGDSVVLRFQEDVDISRGSLLVKKGNKPPVEKELTATLVWLDEQSSIAGGRYLVQAGSRSFQAKLQEIIRVIPPEHPDLHLKASQLHLNDIAEVNLKLAQPAYLDRYSENKSNGVFILVDPKSNHTAAVGFVK